MLQYQPSSFANAVTPFFMVESAKTHPEKLAGVFLQSVHKSVTIFFCKRLLASMARSLHLRFSLCTTSNLQCISQLPRIGLFVKASNSNWQEHPVFHPRFFLFDLRQRRNIAGAVVWPANPFVWRESPSESFPDVSSLSQIRVMYRGLLNPTSHWSMRSLTTPAHIKIPVKDIKG